MGNYSSFLGEILRKTVHLSGLLIVVAYTLLLNYFSEQIAILTLTATLLVLLEIEYIRIEHRPRIANFFSILFRRHEKNQLTGAVFFLISCIISFAAFDYWIAVMAMFMTVFGDLAAALVGQIFGKTKILKKKTFLGTFAGFAANLLVGLLILPGFNLLIFPMAITATLVEMFTNKLDDNLTVPLTAGFVGQMIVYFFSLGLPPIDFTFLGLF